jgi:hypothetical protein
MLRANLKSSKVSVIPNAVDSYSFTPDTSLRPSSSDESKNENKKMNDMIFHLSQLLLLLPVDLFTVKVLIY